MADRQTAPFVLSFGIKSAVEEEYDGVPGLVIQGYASRFGEADHDGEVMLPGAFKDIAETWGAEPEPLILYHHGMDPALRMRRIGKAIAWHVDDAGLYVKSFIPKVPRFTDTAAVRRFADIYNGIKNGRIRGYSVGGFCTSVGKAIVGWSKSELSVTPVPCLASATFTLGSHAVKALLGDTPLGWEDAPPMTPAPMASSVLAEGAPATGGVLTRPHFGQVMQLAQDDKDTALHDHLLARPAFTHGPHNAGACPICADNRAAHGMKAAKDGPDGDYLVVEDDGTQHLRVKRNGTPDHGLMGAAWAALTSNHRGQPYAGPNKAEALAKLRALYTAEGMDTPDSDGKAGQKAIDAATAILARYTADRKAGKRHSAATRKTVQSVIETLQQLIAEDAAEEADDGDAAYGKETAHTT